MSALKIALYLYRHKILMLPNNQIYVISFRFKDPKDIVFMKEILNKYKKNYVKITVIQQSKIIIRLLRRKLFFKIHV